MARRTEAYVDTGAFIAFLDRSDSHHIRFRQLFADPPPLATSALVVAEGQGWFLKRYDSTRALQFLAFIEELTPLTIADVGAAELRRGAEMLRRFSGQPLTMTDAVGLSLMQTRRSRICWSTDRHLRLTGVPLVIDDR